MSAKPIVAATDGSEDSLRAVDWAAREAVLRGAPLRIVSAAALLPRMIGGHAMSDYDTVADNIRTHRDQALAAGTERAAKAAPGLLVDADRLDGPRPTRSPRPARRADAGRGLPGSRRVRGDDPRLGQPLRGHPRGLPGRRGPRGDRGRAPAGRCRRRRPGAQPRTARLRVRGGSVAERQCGGAPRLAHAAVRRLAGRAAPAGPAADVFQTETARELEGLLDGWREKFPGVPVSQDVVHGHPGRALAGLSARADLVVVGGIRLTTVPVRSSTRC